MCSPGRALHPAVLAAARLAGVTRVYRVGGVQAIAALAYRHRAASTRVDKIVGPGTAHTQEAKRQVFGQVAIDSEAGPSEVFIVADASARADFLAADLLAQAEHDELASVVLATPSEDARRAPCAPRSNARSARSRASGSRARRCADRSALIVTRDLARGLRARQPLRRRAPAALRRRTPTPASRAIDVRRRGVPRLVESRFRSATTSPGRATSCRPAARRASSRWSASRTSSTASA